MKLLIYGANGYTGRLILDEALAKGIKPTIAGRNQQEIALLAKEKEVEFAVFSMDEKDTLNKILTLHDVVIHCAGPFVHTANAMANACIETKTHYLDITGELQVFEQLHALNDKAVVAGVMLMPGAGFDVVPSDCLAARLKSQLPNATDLTLAFTSTGGGLSRGTAKTMVEKSHEGQWVRNNGKVVSQPMGSSVTKVDFGEFQQDAVGISWGDIATAYYSTGIPNIEVFTGSNKAQTNKLKWMGRLAFLLKFKGVKKFLKKQIDKKQAGPSLKSREKGKMYLWGKAVVGDKQVEARLVTPNGYTLTAMTAVLIASKIHNGDFRVGYQTPSMAYGPNLILEIEGARFLD
jgi:short subunit dehydrogenase-like uncharacterized protein